MSTPETVLTVSDLSDSQKKAAVSLIYDLTLEGYSRPKILAQLQAQKGLDAAELYDEAIEAFARDGFIDKYAITGFCLMAKKQIYQKLFARSDYANALRALESFEKTAASLTPKPAKQVASVRPSEAPLTQQIDSILNDG
jgi:hypothetical protein